MSQRIKKIGFFLAVVIGIGCIYAVVVTYTGLAVPCIFYYITGLKCPGCGVTNLCLSLLRLDFSGAFYSNQMLFLLLPVIVYVFGRYILGYVKSGRWDFSKSQNVLMYGCIGLLFLFNVWRNVYVLFY